VVLRRGEGGTESRCRERPVGSKLGSIRADSCLKQPTVTVWKSLNKTVIYIQRSISRL